jgi:hypothetical protein
VQLQLDFLDPRAKRFLVYHVLEPWRGWRLFEGLWCREGNLIPWVVQTDGEERWVVGIVVVALHLGNRDGNYIENRLSCL